VRSAILLIALSKTEVQSGSASVSRTNPENAMAEVEPERYTLSDGTLVTIRTATADHAPGTLALFRSVVDEGRHTVAEPSEVTTTEAEEREYIEADRENPGTLCLVATVDGTVVGMVRAQAEPYRRTRHFADVDSMLVHAPWRRRGVANLLLDALISWARQHPEIEKLGLYVFSTNTAALRLYKRYGFTIEGRYPRDIKFDDGEYADTVAMGLLVKASPSYPLF
jgi:ribosomal protein S18 acetylase RimI-like enzyme